MRCFRQNKRPAKIHCLDYSLYLHQNRLTYGVIAYRIANRYMGFVRLAESIFQVFGWPDVKHIDLPAATKRTKQPNDPGALGVLYFRY